MTGANGSAALIDAELAGFIQGGVSVVVASRNADMLADAVRGCGCRVARNRRQVTVLVEAVRGSTLLDDIAASGMIAVVFSQPSSHRTIQLKGIDAQVVAVTATDRAVATRHHEQWCADLASIGYSRKFADALHGRPAQLAAIRFTATAAFQQTPGPGAGQRLAR